MAAMFFDESKIPTVILFTIPYGTIMPSFRTFGSVVSEEKMFEKVYGRRQTTDDGRKVIAIAHRPERSGELKKVGAHREVNKREK